MLIRNHGAAFGAVISASHNPPIDNGIKFFNARGYKPDDTEEAAIERLVAVLSGSDNGSRQLFEGADGLGCGRIESLANAVEDYIESSLGLLGGVSLQGLKVVIDPGHGAAGVSSPEILRRAGAGVVACHELPDGARINVNCGCTHPQVLQALVREHGADVGIAHDGDADRVVMCDETGAVLDGDELMAILALDLLRKDCLHERTLVTTVMSNQGLAELLRQHEARMIRTAVGDRHVIAAMRQHGYNLGGEQSGHNILHDHNTTGDGIAAAIQRQIGA
jgi:phosphoglucosamine mutase